jgi:hypothetical protein
MNCVDNGDVDRQDPTATAQESDTLATLLSHIEAEDALWVGRNLPVSQADKHDFQEEHMTCYPMHSKYGSRIDRIYIPKGKSSWVHQFTTKAPSVESDHKQISIVLTNPTAIQTKRHTRLYANNTEDFMAAQPLLSNLLKEIDWQDMTGATITKRWDDLKVEIRHRLQDLQRIKKAIQN